MINNTLENNYYCYIDQQQNIWTKTKETWQQSTNSNQMMNEAKRTTDFRILQEL